MFLVNRLQRGPGITPSDRIVLLGLILGKWGKSGGWADPIPGEVIPVFSVFVVKHYSCAIA